MHWTICICLVASQHQTNIGSVSLRREVEEIRLQDAISQCFHMLNFYSTSCRLCWWDRMRQVTHAFAHMPRCCRDEKASWRSWWEFDMLIKEGMRRVWICQRRKLHQQSWKCISPCQRWLGQANPSPVSTSGEHQVDSSAFHFNPPFCASQSFLASCSPSPTVAQVSCCGQLCGCSGQILLFCIPGNQLKTVCPVAEKARKALLHEPFPSVLTQAVQAQFLHQLLSFTGQLRRMTARVALPSSLLWIFWPHLSTHSIREVLLICHHKQHCILHRNCSLDPPCNIRFPWQTKNSVHAKLTCIVVSPIHPKYRQSFISSFWSIFMSSSCASSIRSRSLLSMTLDFWASVTCMRG